MLAARLEEAGGALRLVELPTPQPAGTEVRIRVAGCGVCHTDLHILDGTQSRVELPLTLGHEVAGVIEAVGPAAPPLMKGSGMAIGDAVLVYGGWGCGACRDCLAGAEQRCDRSRAPGFQVDGGYAEAMIVDHPRHLVPLGGLHPMTAAPLADAGVTPYRAVRRAEPWLTAGARVLLIGCGALGQFALQYLRLLPAAGEELKIAVRELDPARLERAAQLGADAVLLDGDDAMALDALGDPPDVIFDLVGNDATLARAAALVAPGGLVMLIGEAGGRIGFGFDAVPIESWLTTVAWGSLDDLRTVVRLASGGRVSWQTDPVPLRDAASALDRLRRGDVDGRLVLVP